ncbi:MAG TPA: hypothetical protein VFB67_09840, partial [Candidatus Polarisedimenticolaceae bacterium]|nr:hypothetical protein [Candidatus Polarisedimenticolaceae bacterium]
MRTLRIGPLAIRFEGLGDALDEVLDDRFGGFVERGKAAPSVTVRRKEDAAARGLAPWAPGERYRIEADRASGRLVVRSYHFVLSEEAPGSWRLSIDAAGREPAGRILENVARYVLAHLAIERGGFALHGAGVRREGRAWIFAGPSGAGKTTAAALSRPCESLGDDFAVVLPDGEGLGVPAVPFDNAEVATEPAVRGLVPLAG